MTVTRPKPNQTMFDVYEQGDPEDLDKFYLENRQEFIKWMQNTFRISADDATDIYQDAIIVILKKLKTEDFILHSACLKVFVFAIGRNMAFKLLQKRNKEGKAWGESGKWGDPDDTIEFTETQKIAMEFYEKLPEPCKSILRLYYFEQLSMREIAEQLGYHSEDVVKNQKCRCIKAIRDKLFPSNKK
ncbi:RNA polymerase sigma factor [Adhaeribacter radiodurans]|uniref:Sigma-70 family RNA polymerase sigma factor n=1 Tax=Adhaeribacter radiodurans TaxID=2745197 RepID=A0A7L7LCV6_9BACT|nr:sigma-70 family RNA polymerase sigma factor [Adhaeribacter radiodurans]QMU30524.1 sigma-70 family RNA polymerase sigma factor [Adhaeribacter radiodurans]